MLNVYTRVTVLVLFALTFTLTLILCLRLIQNFLLAERDNPPAHLGYRVLNTAGYTAGALLFIVLLFLPLALWPLSSINPDLAWDAGVYHLPRAAELVVSHTLLDLSISYGEYPSGSETLIAFALILNRDGYLIGLTHALIMAFFLLATFLLCRRFSRLPGGVIFFVVVFVFASYDLIRFIESNPFSWIRLAGFTIGKNDFLISSAIIALLAFSPLGPKDQAHRFSLPGMALTGFLIAATKPNGLVILAVSLALVGFLGVKQVIKRESSRVSFFRYWAATVLLLLCGLSWVLRNLLINKTVFSEDVLEIQRLSILNNLFNPFFYQHMGVILQITLVVFIVSIIASIFLRKVHWTIPFIFGVLLFSFAATPSTAFWGSTQQPAEVAWRFGVYLLVYLLPVILLLLDPVVMFVLRVKNILMTILLAAAMGGIAIAGTISNLDRLKPDTQNLIVLRDQFREPVGTGGYFSAYDYIRKNVSHSVVWVENGMPFYVFGEGLTNSISRKTAPDYWVFLQTPWITDVGYPEKIESDDFLAGWKLVYQDNEGRVYRNRASE